MPSEILLKEQRRDEIPLRYRFFRTLLRTSFALSRRTIRLLGAEFLPDSGATLFFVGRPARFHDALVLVAVMEREVRCLVDEALLLGPLRRVWAWGLGMIPVESGKDASRQCVSAARRVLLAEGAIVVFAPPATRDACSPCGLPAAAIALAADAEVAERPPLMILPVHLFLPSPRSSARESLVYVTEPIFSEDYGGQRGDDSPDPVASLAAALSLAVRPSAFRLQPEAVGRLLSAMEEVLRGDLAELWVTRPNWKQTAEDFTLSQRVKDWTDETNETDPAALVDWRESLDAYREARRLRSLRQLQMETEEQLRSPWGRLTIWAESIGGVPLALWGLLNHLLAGLIMLGVGLLKRGSQPVSSGGSAARAGIVLCCYAGQIALVAHALGRAAAGYYALTLPVSGAYLWRYYWLFRHRTRVLLALAAPVGEAKLRRLHHDLVARFDEAQRAYAEKSVLERSPSTN